MCPDNRSSRWEYDEATEAKKETRQDDREVPRNWQPDETTVNEIANPKVLLGKGEIKNTGQDEIKSTQKVEKLTSQEKGTVGERAVIREAEQAGHVILVEHSENSTAQGFDCVSIEPVKGELHVWEAKNMPSRDVRADDLTAWRDVDKSGNPRKGYRRSWDAVVNSVPEGPVKDAVKQAVNEGKVYFHLRVAPETEISPSLKKELDEANIPGAHYDWKKYREEDM